MQKKRTKKEIYESGERRLKELKYSVDTLSKILIILTTITTITLLLMFTGLLLFKGSLPFYIIVFLIIETLFVLIISLRVLYLEDEIDYMEFNLNEYYDRM